MSNPWGYAMSADVGTGFDVGGVEGGSQGAMYGGLGAGKAPAHVVTGEVVALYLLLAFYVGAIRFGFSAHHGG